LEPPQSVDAIYPEGWRVVARDRIGRNAPILRARLVGPRARSESAALALLVGDRLFFDRRDAALAAAMARLKGEAPALAAVVVSAPESDDAALLRFVRSLTVSGG
ncbi:MAG: hypothetical protein K2Q06_07620, partial [Parvularculaceae bacterium]|nr:hypothetical protein [Parvularculaceae bacterium]